MRLKIKILIIAQLLIIVALSFWIYYLYSNGISSYYNNDYPLLSTRISYNILEPKSYLLVNYDPLKEELNQFVSKNSLNTSIYVENLRDGASFGINQEQTYKSGSMGKVATAILIMKEIERGSLTLDTELEILDSDKDSMFGTFYQTDMKKASVEFLMEKMLKESDNTATLVLHRYINPNDYTTLLEKYYGYYDESMEKEPIMVNTITMYDIYSSLFLSTALSAEDSQYILNLLTDTDYPINQFAKIPDNVTIAQKYGVWYANDEEYYHDCGIIYDGDLRIFYCVMTENLDMESGTYVIGHIVNRIYSYSKEQRTLLDTYS